ncbi:uncharacterized protein NMK_1913 [Novimethylophilus kurashikiensis]|uniref:Uncharacterized protein n=1 Tax=Novimethylophilus kurashikiensis TaxID=1825523 RepID=A0A2R5F8F7_9PROT|nr:AAA family ATPase [Novimethylophilus kurashikiensis]GBG14315.1 uncharacterized protein NMK_1913 [Novimethylophilus kurashikiensis]
MQFVNLEVGTLYLTSGLPGAGKSTWLGSGNILPSMILSADAIRESVLGHKMVGGLKHIFQDRNDVVWSLLNQILEVRLKEKLTTFVDATLLNDAEREPLVKLAQKHGVKVVVLIFDRPFDTCMVQNISRQDRVSEYRMNEMSKEFQLDSMYPFVRVPEFTVPRLVSRDLPDTNFDVIGDVHGLLDDLKVLLGKLGYSLESGVPVHPQGRKLLFLGDVVDRGPQSIETLKFVRQAIAVGHLMVAGNHERKLLQFWDSLQTGAPRANSPSAAETAMEFMKLREEEQQALIQFVRNLPGFYTVTDGPLQLAFAHAPQTAFHPFTILHSECLYGGNELPDYGDEDADGMYAESYRSGESRHMLIHGHIPLTSMHHCVFSLDAHQAFAGNMLALRLDGFLADCREKMAQEAFNDNLVSQKCEFDFDVHSAKFELKRSLDKLKTAKMVTVQTEPSAGLSLYKYSKRVFFDALWGESPYLLKARGIVLDLAGNIVVHPFDKVFNYGENGAGLDIADDHPVYAVEKMNGFLGCISRHPWKNELLVTSSGSFDSPFVDYIKSFITPALKGLLLSYFSRNNVTLMFEVLHPEDPHIIQYRPQDMGLWLIGGRGKEQGAEPITEDELDEIGLMLTVNRPEWFYTSFGQLKEKVATSRLEGYMVRDAKSHKTLLKFKTPYYLVTKFLGRMSDTKVRHMFCHPKGFKKDIDEEFYPLVDHLVTTTSETDFLALPDTERVVLVRDAIQALR